MSFDPGPAYGSSEEYLTDEGLKEAVTGLKEVAEGMKETSIRMQNATLALLEGQKRLESGFKKTKEKNIWKACKRFRRRTKKNLKCIRRRSRKLKGNQEIVQQV